MALARRSADPEHDTTGCPITVLREARYPSYPVVDGGVLVQQRSPQVEVFGLDRYPRIAGSLFS